MSTVEMAKGIAYAAHYGVERVITHEGYINHPRRVAEAVVQYGEDHVIVAWLHDVVEDTEITLDYLLEIGFSKVVVDAVDSVTKRHGETYMDMVRRAKANPIGRIVKLADNADNSSDLHRMELIDKERYDFQVARYTKARILLLED